MNSFEHLILRNQVLIFYRRSLMMATSPQLKFVFTADISNAEKAMNKTIGHLKRMSKEALSTAANMTFVTDAFKRIGKIALEG